MSLLDSLATDSRARLVRTSGDAYMEGFTLVREWPNMHASYVDTVAYSRALNNRKIVNPVANRQAFSGQYIRSKLEAVQDDQRKYYPRETLTRFTPATDSAFATRTPIHGARQSVLNAFGIEEGTDQFRTHIFPFMDPTDTAVVAELARIDTLAGYTSVDRRVVIDDETQTATITQLHEKTTWTNNDPTFKVHRIENEKGWGENTLRRATGMDIDCAVNWVADTDRTNDSLLMVSLTERAKGEGNVAKLNRTGPHKGVTTFRQRRVGTTAPARAKTWYGVPLGSVDTTVAAAVLYTGDAGDTMSHYSERIAEGANGFSTITAVATNPNSSISSAWPESTDTISFWFKKVLRRSTDTKGNHRPQKRTLKFKHMSKYTATQAAADNFVEGANDTLNDIYLPGSGVRVLSQGKFIGVKIREAKAYGLGEGWINDD